MGRNPRYIPQGGALVEVTCRTVQGRLLLRPSRKLNETVIGALARARKLYPVELSGAVYLSNHCHLLVWVEEVEHLAGFMGHLNGNLAREVCRLHGWSDKVWARRYQAIPVSDEHEAQVARFKYLLSQGVKEGLVARPHHWPGVHCAKSLLSGEPLEGFWFDRTRESASRRRGERCGPYDHAEEEILTFHKLPCWRHLNDEDYRRRVANLVEEIEQEGSVMRRERAIFLPGAKALRRQNPHAPVAPPERRATPQLHAFHKRVRHEMRQAYGLFLAAYREAARQLRNGERRVRFPPGCFPPGLPYVPQADPRPP